MGFPPPFKMSVKLRKGNIGEPKHVHSYSDDADADDDKDDNNDSLCNDGIAGKDGFQSDRMQDLGIQQCLTNCIVSSDSH